MHNNNDRIVQVYLAIRKNLARAVSHIVPPKEIEDIVQETYVRVCQIKDPDEIRHPRSFLLKTAKNLAFDHLKRAETRLSQSMDEDLEAEWNAQSAQGDEPYDKVAANQEFAHFCEAVRHLPVQCRKVFVLKKVYGHSQKEIAAQLQISESTVEKHIANGIKRCTYYMSSRQSAYAPGENNSPSRAHKPGATRSK